MPFPGEGNGNPLQYSWLKNPMNRGPCGLESRGLTELDMTEATWHAWSRLDFSTQVMVSGRKDCSEEAQCMRDSHYTHHFCSHSTN